MSQRLLSFIISSSALWAGIGLLFGVAWGGFFALWAGTALSLVLAVQAWNTFSRAEPWDAAVLAAVAASGVVAIPLFVVLKQATHHRPLGAATLAVSLLFVFSICLAVARRIATPPLLARGALVVSLLTALGLGWRSLSWSDAIQLGVGILCVGLCLVVQKRVGTAAKPTQPKEHTAPTLVVVGAIVLANLAFLVLGLPPSVQEAPILLGLLGILS